MLARRASSASACWTWDMEKCVSRAVTLSGPSSSAAKGRLSCSVVAVFCSCRHVSIAASIWFLVKGVRTGSLVGTLEIAGDAGAIVEGGTGEVAEDTGVI